jgi:hypothetical protein
MNGIWQEARRGIFVGWELGVPDKPFVEFNGMSIEIISGDRKTTAAMADVLLETTKRLREKIAEDIERERRLNHETHALPLCADCHAIEVLDKAAAIARGKK